MTILPELVLITKSKWKWLVFNPKFHVGSSKVVFLKTVPGNTSVPKALQRWCMNNPPPTPENPVHITTLHMSILNALRSPLLKKPA